MRCRDCEWRGRGGELRFEHFVLCRHRGSERILHVVVWLAHIRRMDRWIEVAQLEVRDRERGAEHELRLLRIRGTLIDAQLHHDDAAH